jgi:hypothetical protein
MRPLVTRSIVPQFSTPLAVLARRQGFRRTRPTSSSTLLCAAALRAFPEPFCGTDGSLLQAEYRIRDAAVQNLKFTIFTETGSNRIRGGSQAFAPPRFQWHADSGIEVRFRGVTVDVARGAEGYRLNLGLSGQAF